MNLILIVILAIFGLGGFHVVAAIESQHFPDAECRGAFGKLFRTMPSKKSQEALSFIRKASGYREEVLVCEHSPNIDTGAYAMQSHKGKLISLAWDMPEYLSRDELRAVFGHEVGHLALRHTNETSHFEGEVEADRFAARYVSAEAMGGALRKIVERMSQSFFFKPKDPNEVDNRLRLLGR